MSKWSLIAILSCVPLTSSCLAVAGLTVGAAGAIGYVYYDKNEAQRDFKENFDKIWKVTLDSLRGLKYALPKDPQHETDSGNLVIDDLVVRVVRLPGNTTRVTVRVGTFDSEEHRRRAGLIFEKIDAQL